MAEAGPGRALLSVRDLRTWFPIRRLLFSPSRGYIKAVDGVSFDLYPGETLGLVGESGCGKTTLGRTLLRLERASRGRVMYNGHDLLRLGESALRPLRRRLQMIFQDPYSSLNPRLAVRDIVTEGLRQHGLLDGSLDAVANPSVARGRVWMPARCTAIRTNFRAASASGSVLRGPFRSSPSSSCATRRSAPSTCRSRPRSSTCWLTCAVATGLSYLFISHDLSVIRHISQRVAVMYLGRLVEMGETRAVIDAPKHPYTQALVSAIPVPGKARSRRIVLRGDVPSPANPPSGCRFHNPLPPGHGPLQDR